MGLEKDALLLCALGYGQSATTACCLKFLVLVLRSATIAESSNGIGRQHLPQMYGAAATTERHAVGIPGYVTKVLQAPVTAPNVATVNGEMRANTVGSNGMGTKSDRLMKEALLVYRIIINEKELSKIFTGNNFAGQEWWHIHY